MKNNLKEGLALEYITLAWNVVGCIVVIVLALRAASLSLFGFGIDSVIEIFASIIVIWQLKAINKDKEKFAAMLIGIAFMLLSVYIAIQAVVALTHRSHPLPSPCAAVWLLITAVAMFVLAYRKKKVGLAINNPVLLAESKVTVVDGLLAASVLIALLLNMYLGWWWADIAASLVIVFYGMREAMQSISAIL